MQWKAIEEDIILCGTIEAAKLWYQTLSKYLAKAEFIANLQDQCVFNKFTEGYKVTITLHDCMISCAKNVCLEDIDIRRAAKGIQAY